MLHYYDTFLSSISNVSWIAFSKSVGTLQGIIREYGKMKFILTNVVVKLLVGTELTGTTSAISS